ncbi:unnamed protein product [Heterobilharzia americana]|nr:unnamed protein product [Heterobilharzia americana]
MGSLSSNKVVYVNKHPEVENSCHNDRRDEIIIVERKKDITERWRCVLWLYGLTKTRWNVQSENRITRPGSLASGINLLRSTSNFNRLNNAANSYTADNKFCKLLSSASNALKQTAASKPLDYSSIRLPLSTCCTDQGYLSDTHYKSSCDYNHSSYILDREVGLAARIGGSWISASGSFNSSLDARSSTKSFHSAGKFDSPSRTSNFNDFSHRTMEKIFELDTDKKKCIYHGDLQLIYKSKVDLLKQYQHVLSSKSDQSTRNSITEIVKNIRHKDDDNLNVNCDGNESPNEVPSFDEKTNRSGLQQQHSISKRYYELLNNMNDKSLTSGDRNAKLKPKFILTRGIHVFDFEFQLPADLPGSFELPTNCLAGGASASITYAVRLEICNNRLKMRHIQQREIIVFRPLELIHFPRLRNCSPPSNFEWTSANIYYNYQYLVLLSHFVPCYASFNFASGDIAEYDPLNQNNSTRMTPVYRYFKPKPMEQTANKSNITFSSDSPVNSSSIKSLQNTSKSSPSILKPTGTSSTSTNTGTGNSTNISGENRQYSLKSNKSLYCTEHSQKSPRHQQQVKQQLSSLIYSPDDAVVASFTTLYNSDGAKSDTCSYNQILNKKHKQVSSYKLRRQNNFQELTPHKTHISLSAGVITNPINLDTRSPELCLSNQQFFDDGDVTLSNMTNSADDNVISTSFRSNKLNKDNALNFSFSKDQSQIIHQPIQHLKYLDGNERACLSSGLREHHHPHDSSVCSKYVENSSLEYKCKSQTNIPLRQYSFGLFSDERSSFDDREDCRNQRHQSNEYCQQYSSELVRPKQIHYGVDDDEENNEEEEDEDDNIPYEKGCTGRLLNPDNLSRSRSTSSSNFSQNEEEEEYDDDLDDDLNNTCEEENAMGNHEDDILAADKEGESDKNYTDQQQKQNQQSLQQHRLKTYQDESLSQASLNLNHTPSDIKELYFKVQQISDQKNISINYKFKQSKNIHDAY